MLKKNISTSISKYLQNGISRLFPNSKFPDKVIGHRLLSESYYGKVLNKINMQNQLYGKTQVYIGYDHDISNRLNHVIQTMELTMAFLSSVGLNHWLGGAVAFAHDSGHVAFGHSGERALKKCLLPTLGGFHHALFGAYYAIKRLNFHPVIAEGIALHSGSNTVGIVEEPAPFGPEKQSFWANIEFNKKYLNIVRKNSSQASYLETACIALFDDLAYLSTDLEIEITSGRINYKDLPPSFFNLAAQRTGINPRVNPENNVKRAFLDLCLSDLIQNTLANFQLGIRKINFSPEVGQMKNLIRKFCWDNVYEIPSQQEVHKASEIIMTYCFKYFLDLESRNKTTEYTDPLAIRHLHQNVLLDHIIKLTDREAITIYKKHHPKTKNKLCEKENTLKVLEKHGIRI